MGADLYGSDATLYTHGDVRRTHTGATDLWATDATLYATHEDHERARAEVLKAVLRARAMAMETAAHDRGGDAGEDADDAVCPVCLGGTSGRDGTDEGDGEDQQNREDYLDDGILVADAAVRTPAAPAMRAACGGRVRRGRVTRRGAQPADASPPRKRLNSAIAADDRR